MPLGTPTSQADEPTAMREMELTCIDDAVIHSATFQSNTQHLVFNRTGVFAAFVKSRNEDYTAQNWRLVRSTDDGRSIDGVVCMRFSHDGKMLATGDDQGRIRQWLLDKDNSLPVTFKPHGPHRPQLWRTKNDRLSADILLCLTLRISLRDRTPKRCSVGASPNRTRLAVPKPKNLALTNNDNGNKSCATKRPATPVF